MSENSTFIFTWTLWCVYALDNEDGMRLCAGSTHQIVCPSRDWSKPKSPPFSAVPGLNNKVTVHTASHQSLSDPGTILGCDPNKNNQTVHLKMTPVGTSDCVPRTSPTLKVGGSEDATPTPTRAVCAPARPLRELLGVECPFNTGIPKRRMALNIIKWR